VIDFYLNRSGGMYGIALYERGGYSQRGEPLDCLVVVDAPSFRGCVM